MDDKIWIVIAVTCICLAVLCVAVNIPHEIPSDVIGLIDKALLGLFALATGASAGFTLGKKSKNPTDTTKP